MEQWLCVYLVVYTFPPRHFYLLLALDDGTHPSDLTQTARPIDPIDPKTS